MDLRILIGVIPLALSLAGPTAKVSDTSPLAHAAESSWGTDAPFDPNDRRDPRNYYMGSLGPQTFWKDMPGGRAPDPSEWPLPSPARPIEVAHDRR